MVSFQKLYEISKLSLVVGLLATLVGTPSPVQAQALEEIVVTAQRREQSLQEVPISIEAFSGAEIEKQGFRDMVDLANFSPTVEIETSNDRTLTSIRGVGTAGNNQVLEQAAPIFVDGIHFGRTSQIMGAFLDVDRVEILRGPQPVYFGQNATAGAFSITTRKPTETWVGNVRSEIGNMGKVAIEGGVGGPVTDTFGVRFAGKYDRTTGHLRDLLSGKKYPEYRVFSGRTILQWTPTDNFKATAKIQYSDKHTGGEGTAISRLEENPLDLEPDRYGTQTLRTGLPNVYIRPIPNDPGWGVQAGVAYVNPTPAGLPWLDESNRLDIDLSGFLPDFISTGPHCPGGSVSGGNSTACPTDLEAKDDQKAWDGYLNFSYILDSGIELESQTGYSRYRRQDAEDNSGHYFLSNYTFRAEYLDQWSEELRVSSPVGGVFEWMLGAYYQINDLDLKTYGFRANVRRPARSPTGSETSEWMSAFATVTYNFLDGRASLDVGARYTDVEKRGIQQQWVQEWIFEDIITGEPFVIPNQTTHNQFRNNFPDYVGATPIGMTPEYVDAIDGNAKNDQTFKEGRLDPQIVLRYRPRDNISLYAKYATAFKSGAFEVELKSVTPEEVFTFDSEYAKIYEVGAKGTFLDGRARGSLTVFRSDFEGLQVATGTPPGFVLETGINSATVNAGLQRVQGIEFDATMLVGDRMTLGFAGGFFDGEMVEFERSGCTEFEEDSGLCGDDGFIDRSGAPAPRTPDWIVTMNANYWMPVSDSLKLDFNGRFKYSDGYIISIENFSLSTQMPTHADMNLALGIGDINDSWMVSVYGRNLLEPRQKYFPEFDTGTPSDTTSAGSSRGEWMTYGIQFRYNYN